MATTKATATLGGFDLLFGDEPVQWTLRPGVLPSTGTFTMDPSDAKKLESRTTPVELVIRSNDGAPVIVKHLWVLSIEPGDHPFHSVVKVADRRWMWDRAHVFRRLNMRRAVGVKRLLANDAALEVNFDRAPDIAYWRWSIPAKGRKWEALTAIQTVMTEVAKIERNYWGQTFEVVVDSRIGTNIKALPIEEFSVDDNGAQSVNLLVAYLPEADVTVDYDGKVIFFSKAAGDEVEIVKALMPEIFGRGHTDLVKNSIIRPKEIHVLF